MKLKMFFSSLMMLLILTCCKDKSDPAPDNRTLIISTWSVNGGYVKLDGTTITTLDNLEITLHDNNTYTSTGGATSDLQMKVFLPEGTWKWQGTETTSILRDDILTEVKELTNNSLIIKFTLTEEDAGNINGKVKSVTGSYEIKFVKK